MKRPATEADINVGAQLTNRMGTVFTVTERTETGFTVEFTAPVGGNAMSTTYTMDRAVLFMVEAE